MKLVVSKSFLQVGLITSLIGATVPAFAGPGLKGVLPSIAVVGPSGEVIAYEKQGDQIIIRQCAKNTTTADIEKGCELKDGTREVKISELSFKNFVHENLMLMKEAQDLSSEQKAAVENYLISISNIDTSKKALEDKNVLLSEKTKKYLEAQESRDLLEKDNATTLGKVETEIGTLKTELAKVQEAKRKYEAFKAEYPNDLDVNEENALLDKEKSLQAEVRQNEIKLEDLRKSFADKNSSLTQEVEKLKSQLDSEKENHSGAEREFSKSKADIDLLISGFTHIPDMEEKTVKAKFKYSSDRDSIAYKLLKRIGDIIPCNKISFNDSKAGERCITSVGAVFTRVDRNGFGKAWKDPAGVIWSEPLGTYPGTDFDRALKRCQSLAASVPSDSDFRNLIHYFTENYLFKNLSEGLSEYFTLMPEPLNVDESSGVTTFYFSRSTKNESVDVMRDSPIFGKYPRKFELNPNYDGLHSGWNGTRYETVLVPSRYYFNAKSFSEVFISELNNTTTAQLRCVGH